MKYTNVVDRYTIESKKISSSLLKEERALEKNQKKLSITKDHPNTERFLKDRIKKSEKLIRNYKRKISNREKEIKRAERIYVKLEK
jgi:hypothetical protein